MTGPTLNSNTDPLAAIRMISSVMDRRKNAERMSGFIGHRNPEVSSVVDSLLCAVAAQSLEGYLGSIAQLVAVADRNIANAGEHERQVDDLTVGVEAIAVSFMRLPSYINAVLDKWDDAARNGVQQHHRELHPRFAVWLDAEHARREAADGA